MTVRFRLQITKGEEARYISHLDYARTMERALRRAKLPVAYSEGFNPHMKMAFASALPVGVASVAEYMDVELTDEAVDAAAVERALGPALPAGIALRRVKPITVRHAALMAVVNLASYRVVAPLAGEAAYEAAAEAAARFNAAVSVPYVKESPKGKREIDIKTYVDRVELARRPKGAELAMEIRITPTGSVKPLEVFTVLTGVFGLPADPADAVITRTGLYVAGGAGRVSPLDI